MRGRRAAGNDRDGVANCPAPTDTKERPFKCLKCRSTFVRRDLLLRHDRTVHAKDGGAPLPSEQKRRAANKAADAGPSKQPAPPPEVPQMDDHEDDMVDADIEAAAMLMTDFHHRAMASQEPEMVHSHSEHVMSPTGPSMMEPVVPYTAPGQNMLPQMPWRDSMVPQPEPKSQPDAHSAFHGASHLNSHPHQLPPLMERTMSGSDSLTPAFQSMNGGNGLGTPGALSPYPSMMGPVSPVDYRKSPGPSQALTMTRAPQLDSEEQCVRIYENIKQYDSENALLETFHLPSLNTLNRLLKTYFDLFHHHLPFLHPATFNPTEVSAPLLLAVLSIGALYIFDQDQAYMLHIGSKVLVNQFLQNKENFSSRKCPLWTMQSTLLNMIFSSWSGDPKGLEWACSIKSLLANVSTSFKYHANMADVL
jgi:hypothetical protein